MPACLSSFAQAQPADDNLYLKRQLSKAIEYRDKGDLLFSAQLFNYVINQATDSLLKAEALYKLTTVGDSAAIRYTTRFEARYAIPEGKRQDWYNLIVPQIKREMALWDSLRIDLVHVEWFDDHYVSDNTKIYKELSKNYPETEWGEAALMHMVTDDRHGSNSPETIIERGLAFLQKYPDSEHKPWIYTALGYSYSDALKLINCYADSADEQELREGAIKYMILAVETHHGESDVGKTMTYVVSRLTKGECPEFYFFFSD